MNYRFPLIEKLPPYVFAVINELKRRLAAGATTSLTSVWAIPIGNAGPDRR
jgi:hypothetical protein